uniref:Uncharacterized protein n=1 Tax=Cynoglossus semilaevis TaxID=244447 RepID=A0A3P8WUV2_CYNSE
MFFTNDEVLLLKGLKVSTGSRSVTLQPWLVGLTAVVGFLFIVFIIVIVKRLLRKNRSDTHIHSYTLVRFGLIDQN